MQGNVRSIDALRDLHEALGRLAGELGNWRFDLVGEAERAQRWIDAEVPSYWKQERKLAERKLHEASEALASFEATVGGRERPPATELQQRVYRHRQRLRLCDEKLTACKRWTRELERSSRNLVTAVAPLQHQAEVELPRARGRLGEWITALDRYAQTAPVGSANPTTTAAEQAPPGEARGRNTPHDDPSSHRGDGES